MVVWTVLVKVAISIFTCRTLKDTSQAILARWFDEGLNAFPQKLAQPVARFTISTRTRLIEMLASGDVSKPWMRVIEESAKMNKELKAQLEQGRDRLLEMHSNGGEKAQQIVEKISATDGDTNLVTFALSFV